MKLGRPKGYEYFGLKFRSKVEAYFFAKIMNTGAYVVRYQHFIVMKGFIYRQEKIKPIKVKVDYVIYKNKKKDVKDIIAMVHYGRMDSNDKALLFQYMKLSNITPPLLKLETKSEVDIFCEKIEKVLGKKIN
ncbi:MAG: hypothetical protein KatS3mg096_614 [Candidatus Parcubacteria bacterium]|nr:MAG: hypothetical protein KatS3mg096_614 [Candidatus Parcubacteria bacterium]